MTCWVDETCAAEQLRCCIRPYVTCCLLLRGPFLIGSLAWCRGFAFIEFVTKQEAKNAMESIAGAHLYGRRLVVEWAEQGDEGLDEIRAKTAAKFRGETVDEFDEMPAKRRKANV